MKINLQNVNLDLLQFLIELKFEKHVAKKIAQ